MKEKSLPVGLSEKQLGGVSSGLNVLTTKAVPEHWADPPEIERFEFFLSYHNAKTTTCPVPEGSGSKRPNIQTYQRPKNNKITDIMTYDITTYHAGNMAFDVKIGRHTTRIDTVAPDGEDTGPAPKRLLLGTLAACTGMDVVSLLQKMRVEFSDFSIRTTAELTEEHPKVFSVVEIIYQLKVDEKHHKKVEKAVAMSKEKYCGISAMLARNSPIHFRIEYLQNQLS